MVSFRFSPPAVRLYVVRLTNICRSFLLVVEAPLPTLLVEAVDVGRFPKGSTDGGGSDGIPHPADSSLLLSSNVDAIFG